MKVVSIMNLKKSEELYKEAVNYLVGGVNSPVRAIKPYPFFVSHAKGSKLYDIDGNEYIDYCLAYGPLIFGHANEKIINEVKQQLEKGSAFGTPTEIEVKFAKEIVSIVPCAELVRFVNSGTEATMSAIRLARGYTQRNKIIKLEGGFHGAHDSVLVKAGSGATTHAVPDSLGIPPEVAKNTILAKPNDPETLERIFKAEGESIACMILEPVMGNIGCVLLDNEYLKLARELTQEYNALLIFDEVITGFRLALGGAQEYFDITPDLATLGKIAGGGFPIGIIAGKREIMESFSPLGKVYQAGTFNGNPVSLTAGFTAIKLLKEENVIEKANEASEKLRKGIKDVLEELELELALNGIASMTTLFFTEEVKNYEQALKSDREKFTLFHRKLLTQGIFLPPSQFETWFTSYKHGGEDIEKTVEAMEKALKELYG